MARFSKAVFSAGIGLAVFALSTPAAIIVNSTNVQTGEGHNYYYKNGFNNNMTDIKPTTYTNAALANDANNFATISNDGLKVHINLYGSKSIYGAASLQFQPTSTSWIVESFSVNFTTTQTEPFLLEFNQKGVTSAPVALHLSNGSEHLQSSKVPIFPPNDPYFSSDMTPGPQSGVLPPGSYSFYATAGNDVPLYPTGWPGLTNTILFPMNVQLSVGASALPEPSVLAAFAIAAFFMRRSSNRMAKSGHKCS